MAVVKDLSLFELLEKAGPRLSPPSLAQSALMMWSLVSFVTQSLARPWKATSRVSTATCGKPTSAGLMPTATPGRLVTRSLRACSMVTQWQLAWVSVPSWQRRRTGCAHKSNHTNCPFDEITKVVLTELHSLQVRHSHLTQARGPC